MTFDPDVESKIRKRVEAKLEKRRELTIHIVVFVMANVMLWLLYLMINDFTIPDRLPWALWITVLWGMGLVGHYMDYYYNHGAGHERYERLIDEEVERERQKLYGTRKAKNDTLFYDDSAMHLTEDGEFSDSDLAELDDDARQLKR